MSAKRTDTPLAAFAQARANDSREDFCKLSYQNLTRVGIGLVLFRDDLQSAGRITRECQSDVTFGFHANASVYLPLNAGGAALGEGSHLVEGRHGCVAGERC